MAVQILAVEIWMLANREEQCRDTHPESATLGVLRTTQYASALQVPRRVRLSLAPDSRLYPPKRTQREFLVSKRCLVKAGGVHLLKVNREQRTRERLSFNSSVKGMGQTGQGNGR